ncbi:serine phosphatase RsbU regulator of sigma subunit-like protein [Nitratidesulfovibrio vulgaris RCH1]|nr:serine phosphatase RsbU regulator of sigma subunit-like protein [Nitratidesulfovibrio vulgaris RCH1]
MVGAMPDMTPATITVHIMPGTPHFMYTASPSEAMNANGYLYGRIRLTKTHTSLAGEYTPLTGEDEASALALSGRQPTPRI